MTTYTIQILNNSGFAKSYALFMGAPGVSGAGGSPAAVANVWASFPNVQTGGFDTITYEDVTYAWWGARTPGGGASAGGFEQVNVASRDSVTFQGAAPAGFGPVTPGLAAAGSFQIVAQPDFTAADGFVFGLAKPNGAPTPSPIATFVAEPNDTFTVTPAEVFYMTEGTYTPGEVVKVPAAGGDGAARISFAGTDGALAPSPAGESNQTFTVTPAKFFEADQTYSAGQVIDVSMAGSQVLEIDFTGRAETHAIVVQDARGVLTVTYQ